MNLNYLECFVSLSDTLSFTETAREFSVSQPCISRQIKLLEEQLSMKLFIRDKHKVHLTEEGSQFKIRVKPLINELKSVLNAVQSNIDKVEGSISIGCLSEVGKTAFLPMILDFKTNYPDIKLNISFSSPVEIMDKVKTGQMDFGITTEPVQSEQIKTINLIEENSVLVTSANNINNIADIYDANFVVYDNNDELLQRFTSKYFTKSNFSKIKKDIVVNSHRSMIRALEATQNTFAIMPYFSVEKSIMENRLRMVPGYELKNQLFLMFIDNYLMPLKNSLFKKFIVESCVKKNISNLI